MTHISDPVVLRALEACGRDRVFENVAQRAVAIRWEPLQVPPAEKWIVGGGATLDDAGAAAARELASRVRNEAERLERWAERVEAALAERAAPR